MRAIALAAVIVSAGCGAPRQSEPAETPSVEAKPAVVDDSRGAREWPRTLAALSPESVGFVHIDGERLRQSALYSAYRQLVPLTGNDPLAEARKLCGFDPLQELVTLSIGFERLPAAGSGLAVAKLERPASAALECASKLVPGATPTRLADREAVALGGTFIATTAGDHLLVGDADAVERAIRRMASRQPRALPPAFIAVLERSPTATLVAAAERPSGAEGMPARSGWLSLSSDARRLLLHVEAELSSEMEAKQLAARLDVPATLAQAQPGLDLGQHKRWTEGKTLFYELSVTGDERHQARVIGTLAALSIYAVRKYLARAKEAEAKNTVRHIAKLLVEYVEQKPPGKARLPASAPRTPRDVPSGTRTKIDASLWSHPSWQAIGFSMQDPVYFSYEISTDKGGRSATVRATGDLDGDGVLSNYSLSVKLDARGKATVSPELVIDNELE